MTNEELIAAAKDGDKDAYEEFFKRNMRLIYSVANRYKPNQDVTYEDIVGAAAEGMIKAFNRFDPSYGTKFTTVAVPIMLNKISHLFRHYTAEKRRGVVVSLQSVVFENDQEDITLEDMLEDNSARIDERIERAALFDLYSKFEETLTERDRDIFRLHLSGEVQQKIADRFGISQVQVSRIIAKLMGKFREFAIQKEFIEGGLSMAKTVLDKGVLVYIFKNYPELSDSEIGKILNVQSNNIAYHRKRFLEGKMNNVDPVVPELSISEAIHNLIVTKANEVSVSLDSVVDYGESAFIIGEKEENTQDKVQARKVNGTKSIRINLSEANKELVVKLMSALVDGLKDEANYLLDIRIMESA